MSESTHSSSLVAFRIGFLCAVAALLGCSRAGSDLTPAAIQALVDTRARALEARDAPTLCSQYSDSARFHGVFGDEQLVLPKSRFCEQLAQDFAAASGEGQRFVTTLSVKGVTIGPNGKDADLELEQVDVAEAQRDSKPYERRTQIRARVESVAGKPLITREEQKETIRQVSELPRNVPSQSVGSTAPPPSAKVEIEAETKQMAEDLYRGMDPSIPEKDRRAVARTMAEDLQKMARDSK